MKKHRVWIQRTLPLLDQDIQFAQEQSQSMQTTYQTLANEYNRASQVSLGLSANLEVEKINDAPPEVNVVRSTGVLIVVGSCLGLMLWMFLWAWQLSQRA